MYGDVCLNVSEQYGVCFHSVCCSCKTLFVHCGHSPVDIGHVIPGPDR